MTDDLLPAGLLMQLDAADDDLLGQLDRVKDSWIVGRLVRDAAAVIRAQAERIAELIVARDAHITHSLEQAERAEAAERERDSWREEARSYCSNADYWRGRAEKAERERDELRALLAETLQPGAYGIGSTLAQRIDRALAPRGEK